MIIPLSAEMRAKYPGILGIRAHWHESQAILGCHTKVITNTSFSLYFNTPDYVAPSLLELPDGWGNRRPTARGRELLDAFFDSGDMFDVFYSRFSEAIMSTTHLIMSDNVGRTNRTPNTWGLEGVASIVEQLVERKGWGCTASAICSNHNYHASSNPHLVQTFILYPPSAIERGYVTRDTAFTTKNVTEGKISLRDLLNVFWRSMQLKDMTWPRFKASLGTENKYSFPQYFHTIYDYDSLISEPAPIAEVKKSELIQPVAPFICPPLATKSTMGVDRRVNKGRKLRNFKTIRRSKDI